MIKRILIVLTFLFSAFFTASAYLEIEREAFLENLDPATSVCVVAIKECASFDERKGIFKFEIKNCFLNPLPPESIEMTYDMQAPMSIPFFTIENRCLDNTEWIFALYKNKKESRFKGLYSFSQSRSPLRLSGNTVSGLITRDSKKLALQEMNIDEFKHKLKRSLNKKAEFKMNGKEYKMIEGQLHEIN